MKEIKMKQEKRSFFILKDVPNLIFREAICSFCKEFKKVRNFADFNYKYGTMSYDASFKQIDMTDWTICEDCFNKIKTERRIQPKDADYELSF